MENLIEKLESTPNNFTVNMLDDETIEKVIAWAVNYAEEGFSTKEEIAQVKNDVLDARVEDITELMTLE